MKKLWLKIGLSFFILFFVVMVIVGVFFRGTNEINVLKYERKSIRR